MATTSKKAPAKPAVAKSVAAKPASTKKPVAAATPKAPSAKAPPDGKPAPGKTTVAPPVRQVAKAPVHSESAISGLLLEAGAAPLENMQEMVRQFAETGLGQSQSVFNSFRDAADSATVSFEESSAATRSAISKMNDVFTATVLSGSTAMFDAMKAFGEADSASDFATIWRQQSQKQFETIVKNSQELTAAIRSCAEEAAKPFVSAYSHSFQG